MKPVIDQNGRNQVKCELVIGQDGQAQVECEPAIGRNQAFRETKTVETKFSVNPVIDNSVETNSSAKTLIDQGGRNQVISESSHRPKRSSSSGM